MFFRVLIVAFVLAACGGDDSIVALFDSSGTQGFYSLPFPSNERLAADGTIDLRAHPYPNELAGGYFDAIDSSVRGYSRSPVVFFRFDGEVDPASLPATPALSLLEDASVYLVSIDQASPDYGVRYPCKFRFESSPGSVIGDNWLAVAIYPGFVLREGTTYAAIVTRRLRANGGDQLSRDGEFSEIVHGDADPSRQAIYAPLAEYLATDGSDGFDDVVSVAVFTTQETNGLLRDAREVVRSGAAPVARDIASFAENTAYAGYAGLWDAPNFQRGEPPYRREGGGIEIDADGMPIVQRSEELRFAVTVPLGDPPASGWPVVLYAHGTGGSYRTFTNNGVARALANAGIAAISMDQVLHGPRDPTGGSPELNFFNFLNPESARDNTLQGAIDLFNLTYMAERFDYEDAEAGRRVFFDADRMMFYGHSQGGITGTPFLGVEPEIGAAILSGSGGLISLGLLLKTEPIDIAALVATIIRDDPLDEFNPILALLQTYLDRADAINYAPSILLSPDSGSQKKEVFISEGFTDRYTPNPSIEALAIALGVELVEPVVEEIEGLELAGRMTATAPVQGNVGGVTGVLVQYEEEQGSDGHFVLFDRADAEAQVTEFLRSHAYIGEAVLVDAD